MMSPGQYLRLRRMAGDFVYLSDLVDALLRLPERRVPVRPAGWTYLQLVERLARAESNDLPLEELHLALLGRVIALDTKIYRALLALLDDPDASPPRICWVCGCSDHDACHTAGGTCAWASANLCTACQPLTITARVHLLDWPDAPLPEGDRP
jgi:hypothetical protein